MRRKLVLQHISEEETIKQDGLTLDYDEIARKGSMTREEVLISKWYGIYNSRKPGDHMARIVNPGGKLNSVQIRAIADMSEKYCVFKVVSFTTRQAVQLHKLQLEDLPAFLRDVKAAGLTTMHGCGDVNRNVATCPWASDCQHREFDVRPYAEETAKVFAESRDLDNLPRKFKITYSGCSAGCAQPYINCFSGIAVTKKQPDGTSREGFKIVIGGGMGWQPFVAQELYSFVPAEKVVALARAVGILFRDYGDRHIRKYARLKFVVKRLGIDKCRKILEEIYVKEGLDDSDFEVTPIEQNGKHVPARPLLDPDPRDDKGMAIQRIMIPKGELPAKHLRRIAELSELYGDKYVYSTNRQNLELHGVHPDKLPELRKEIQTIGFNAEGFYGLKDAVTCVGCTYCPLAVTFTHLLFDNIQSILNDERFAPIRDRVLVNITGCPNSCSPYYITDIGLRGMRIRENVGSEEAYQIRVGGTQEQFGLVLGEYKADDCERVIETILETFLQYTQDHPEFKGALSDYVHEHGLGIFKQAVEGLGIHYEIAPNPMEYSVYEGEGEQAKDFRNIAKDVPCQEACPAKTNIPEYIRLISEGNMDEAHRINQECNVMPSLLGRICTRPCEDDCRHNWTNTQGPVRICHLKRAAADHKSKPSEPLEPYFEDTDKTVAIIGGGPAGLAAARELRRYGHKVTLYDREKELGGQIRSGVPAFRLPRAALDDDIQAVVNSGITVRRGVTVDTIGLENLLSKHDAVLLATGANTPRGLKIEGLNGSASAIEGLHFMKQYNEGDPLPVEGDVIIIGGGFTAVDCARSSRRLADTDSRVTAIMYRRGVAQMAAPEEELEELRREGVQIETLVSPVRVTVDNGKIVSVTFIRNTLGEPDEDGRPKFIPIEGSEHERPCGTLILATGQLPDKTILPEGMTLTGEGRTSHRKLFVAGDFALGNGDAINAIADGKAAADRIDTVLMERKRRKQVLAVVEHEHVNRVRDFDLLESPSMPVLDLDKRDRTAEVERGWFQDQIETHAKRCYLCNYKFEIDQDLCIHCDWCIKVSPRDCIKRLSHLELDEDGVAVNYTEVPKSQPEETTYIWIDSDNCIRCNKCADICPTNAISLRKADIKGCSTCSSKTNGNGQR